MAYQSSQNQTYFPQQQSSYPQYSQEGYGDNTNYSGHDASYGHDTSYGHNTSYGHDTSYGQNTSYNNGYSSPKGVYPPPTSYTQNPYDTPFDDPQQPPKNYYSSGYPTDYNLTPDDYASTVQLHNDGRDAPVPSKPSDYGGRDSMLESKEYGSPLDRGKKEKKKYKFMIITVFVLGKKPTVQFLGTTPPPDGKPSYVNKGAALDFNLGLRFNVINPNIIGATFSRIQATAFYPNHTTAIGGGSKDNVEIKAKSNTTLNFPFSINYNSTEDPNLEIISDIVKKCGLAGGPKQPIQINYTLKLSLKVLGIPITVSSDRDTKIDCPIQDGKVPAIPGLDIGSLGNSIPQKIKS
ncbi:11101_t:CDS:2 [Paraglomus occultum]|uniref:11101_t:CDS:1 n=1 Tax=Paraglomus occultum TaxID=144539 RepID=A0A9N9C8X1_9GLOM|nr:11101_t:CDS:2 [Paraglomus occultum]